MWDWHENHWAGEVDDDYNTLWANNSVSRSCTPQYVKVLQEDFLCEEIQLAGLMGYCSAGEAILIEYDLYDVGATNDCSIIQADGTVIDCPWDMSL